MRAQIMSLEIFRKKSSSVHEAFCMYMTAKYGGNETSPLTLQTFSSRRQNGSRSGLKRDHCCRTGSTQKVSDTDDGEQLWEVVAHGYTDMRC